MDYQQTKVISAFAAIYLGKIIIETLLTELLRICISRVANQIGHSTIIKGSVPDKTSGKADQTVPRQQAKVRNSRRESAAAA